MPARIEIDDRKHAHLSARKKNFMPINAQPENLEKDILHKSLYYSLALYVRMFIKLLCGIFIAKILGPSLYGLRNAFDLSLSYESYSDLGTFSALNRQAPYFRGEKDFHKFNTAINSIYCVNIIYAIIAAALLIIISQYLRLHGYEEKYVDFALFFGMMIFTSKLASFLETILKIEQNFYLLSKIYLLHGIMASILGVILGYFWGFRGVLTGLLVADIACIALMLITINVIFELKLSFHMYLELLKIGLPMMFLFLLLLLLASADRMLILALISEEALGYFGIATIAASVIGTIPHAIHSVTLAPVMEKFGRTKDRGRVKNYFVEPMILMAYIIPILIVCLNYSIHLPIVYFLDQYVQSITVMKILTIGIFFEAVSSPAMSIALTFNKQVKLIFLVAPLVALNFSLNYLFIKNGWGLNGVAIGTSITLIVYFFVLIFYALRQFVDALKEFTHILLMILAPFSYAVVLYFCIERFVPVSINGLWSDILYTSLKMTLFIVLYCLIFYKIRKHSAFIKFLNHLPFIPYKLKSRILQI
jgi:O-antigen/teichoic acid export membrane protein